MACEEESQALEESQQTSFEEHRQAVSEDPQEISIAAE